MVDRGVRAIAATAMKGRQRVGGFFGKLVQRFQGATSSRSWVLPNGESVELLREKQTNLLLVWSEDEASPIDETRVTSRWPESRCARKVGNNLFLVEIADPKPGKGGADRPMPTSSPREVAE